MPAHDGTPLPPYINRGIEEQLRAVMDATAAPGPVDDLHSYVSTACHHGLHERCRTSCKFCGQLCSCPCHHGAQRPPDLLEELLDGRS